MVFSELELVDSVLYSHDNMQQILVKCRGQGVNVVKQIQPKKLRKSASSWFTPKLMRTAAMMSLDSSGTDSIVLTNEQINNNEANYDEVTTRLL